MRIACVGAGYFARFHLEAWRRIPEVEVVAIVDQQIDKAIALADEFNVAKTFQYTTQMLQHVETDIIDIITPPETHLVLCKEISSFGKHIICQKPLAPSYPDAQKIVQLTEQAGIRFMVHENFRFQPWYRKIRELIDNGAIGDRLHTMHLRMRMGDGWGDDAYLNRQPYFRTMKRLLIYETGIHYIDVFRFLAGKITRVYARLRKLNPVIAGEDCAMVLFDFENGCQGILDANRYNESNHPDPRLTFGTTIIEGNGGTIRLHADGQITVQPLGRSENEVVYLHENKNFAADCVYFTQRHFIECLLNDLPFETEGHDYLNNLIIQDAIYRSEEESREVLVEYFAAS